MNILVSSCLTGLDCKYNGGNNFSKKISALMDKHVIIPVCPEVLGGLPTPRPPAEIKGGYVINKEGVDVTQNFKAGAKKALEAAKKYNCTVAVLKSNSPSCGFGRIYDGTFSGTLIDGNGITAALLKENGIRVLTENDDLENLL